MVLLLGSNIVYKINRYDEWNRMGWKGMGGVEEWLFIANKYLNCVILLNICWDESRSQYDGMASSVMGSEEMSGNGEDGEVGYMRMDGMGEVLLYVKYLWFKHIDLLIHILLDYL